MANKKFLRCSKCGDSAFPTKTEVGTSTLMRCADCCAPTSPYATMCRLCCPTSHRTYIYQGLPEPKGDELMGMPVNGNALTEEGKKRGLLPNDDVQLSTCEYESPESCKGACDGERCGDQAVVFHLGSESELCAKHFRKQTISDAIREMEDAL